MSIHDVVMADELFGQLMAMLDYPVFVVTTQADGQPSGCLVSLTSQTSVQPPSFMVGMPTSSPTVGVANRSEYLAVHVLSRRHQVLAELFGTQAAGDQAKKFDRCSWRSGPAGMPILDDAVAWFVGRTASWSEVGDHVVYLLEPVAAWVPESAQDLLYRSDVDGLDPGDDVDTGLAESEPIDAPRRYGVPRFTLDLP